MSSSGFAFALAGLIWLSLVGLVALILVQRTPKRRKPVDELEAADQAIRGRVSDLEDRFEHYVKRQAGRTSRASVEEAQQALPLPTDRQAALLEITRKAKSAGLH